MFNSDASIIVCNKKRYKDKLTFDLSDFPKYRNCERLLNADWCTYSDEKNRNPLIERLNYIRDVMELCLKFVESLEMFIADEDLTEVNEFSFYEIQPSEFIDVMLPLYNKIGFCPNVHFNIKR
ncbi:MAG: hypothetical protein CVU97_05840 [Firmicutes bacterium HGW-Firmicutes-21]|nr:MAG: hypothetical protein CVU97_05840 [Firmicutes bacterium HGW-Firmicutes-21]